ncbi:hypothetical protein WJX74_004754 [Apatococcus lobatus]|uniref:PsbP C-terminal domain-containing protein n=1 Tax=Apatococcus lobatus TaxID=904363 RepID=A0AAW1S9L0_9CHLO
MSSLPVKQSPLSRRPVLRRHTPSPLPVCCQHTKSSQQAKVTSQQPEGQAAQSLVGTGRRQALGAAASLLLAASSLQNPTPAWAIRGRRPPPGFRLYTDKLDGFSFFYPETWTPVSSSGNEVFLRNPYNVNENLYVTISSPSSSKYKESDLQSPDATAQVILKQFLKEYMSTRLGVRREADIVDAALLSGDDQKQYSQIQVRAKSFASRQQLAVSPQARDMGMEMEWDRRFISVLGVANKRLYQLRLQTADQSYQRNKAVLDQIAQSFQCMEVEA